jgi:hypothetical protein
LLSITPYKDVNSKSNDICHPIWDINHWDVTKEEQMLISITYYPEGTFSDLSFLIEGSRAGGGERQIENALALITEPVSPCTWTRR